MASTSNLQGILADIDLLDFPRAAGGPGALNDMSQTSYGDLTGVIEGLVGEISIMRAQLTDLQKWREDVQQPSPNDVEGGEKAPDTGTTKEFARKTRDARSIHSVALLLSVDPDMSPCRACFLICLSLCVLALQSLVLFSVVLAVTTPGCIENEACARGEFCDLTRTETRSWDVEMGFHGVVGHCADCYRRTPAYIEEKGLIKDVNPTAMNYTMLDQSYCNKTDRLPGRCDWLAESMKQFSITHFLVLTFMLILIIPIIFNELLEASQDHGEYKGCDEVVHGGQSRMCKQFSAESMYRWCLRLFSKLVVRWRMFLIPAQLIGAAAALIISDGSSVGSIILNATAIAFICEVDNTIASLLPSTFDRYVATFLDARCIPAVGHVPHRFLKIWSIVLGGCLFVMVMFPEHVMVFPGVPDEVTPTLLPCTDVLNICRDFTWEVAVVAVLIYEISRGTQKLYRLSVAKEADCTVVCKKLAACALDVSADILCMHFFRLWIMKEGFKNLDLNSEVDLALRPGLNR